MHTLLPFFGIIRATGDDCRTFLHGQLSNDIKNLSANQACYATYNTPKGRVIANMIVYNAGRRSGRNRCQTAADVCAARQGSV